MTLRQHRVSMHLVSRDRVSVSFWDVDWVNGREISRTKARFKTYAVDSVDQEVAAELRRLLELDAQLARQ